MNILILVSGLPPHAVGGTEIQTLEIAKRLSKNHNVTVFTRGYCGAKREERIGDFLVRRQSRTPLGIPTGLHTLSTMYEISKLRNKIDVILCMSVHGGLPGVFAKKLWGTPLVVSIRSEVDYNVRSTLQRAIASHVVCNADVVWVQSDVIKADFQAVFPNAKTFVIPNGVEIDGRVAKGSTIVYVGRLCMDKKNDKGVRFLIEAMRFLSEHELLVVGGGPERVSLESLAHELKVRFVGSVEHSRVRDYLLTSGVFVFPALRGEGFPNAVLEALSVGLPVVASKTAKVQGIIRDGETGFLVDPGKPEQMAARIREILENDDLRARMSKNCLREAREHCWEKVMPKIEDLLEGVGK